MVDYKHPRFLMYKGIIFDDFVVEYSNGNEVSIWATICHKCAKKFAGIEDEVKRSHRTQGYCSVMGCYESDKRATIHYIDFEPSQVTFIWGKIDKIELTLSYEEWESIVKGE